VIIRRIELEDGKPVKIVAEIGIGEAARMAQWTGSLAPATGGDDDTGGIYEALTGDVFNRFWSNGVDGYADGDPE
jgi:hypothetical protein